MARPSDTNPVQKVCRVLRALSSPAPLRLADVAAATGLNKATVLRLLDTLVEEGFARRDPETRRYALGDEAAVLGIAMQRRHHVRERARPWLVRLAGASGDTVLLSTRSGVESVCIDRETGDYPIRANYLDVGSRRPLGVGGGSLALLAWLPDDEIAAILDEVEPTLAERYPRVGRRLIEDTIAESRRTGHVLLLDVVIERMGAVAVPIFGADGRPTAAISIAALSDRLQSRLDVLLPPMRQAALALSAAVPGAVALRGAA
ncbi:MAG TPA: IclR family transcriptional regulator [Burkholderiaceae bacterium]|nr:IclR family transcriptional regulator [Burkholderiaceae bacterium]